MTFNYAGLPTTNMEKSPEEDTIIEILQQKKRPNRPESTADTQHDISNVLLYLQLDTRMR